MDIGVPLDESCRCRPVDELDGAVRFQQQVAGEIGNGRTVTAGVPLDRHEQLMLPGGETHFARLRFAPVQEPAEAGAELQQILEITLLQQVRLPTVKRVVRTAKRVSRTRCRAAPMLCRTAA